MQSKSLRATIILGTAIAAASTAQSLFGQSKCFASDWVEEGVSEFSLPRNRPESTPPASPEDERSPFEKVRTPPSLNSQSGEASSSNSSFNKPSSSNQSSKNSSYEKPRKNSSSDRSSNDSTDARSGKPGSEDDEEDTPPEGPVKNVTDNGGIELGEDGRPRKSRVPLEAGISTWRKENQTYGDGSGIDQRAERLLSQAPRLANPRTISADPKAFKAWLSENHPGLLENANKDQILEVDGEWDDAAHALRTFGLPYTRVSAKKLAEVNLLKTKIIVVNCEGHLSNEAIANIRRFVAMGGYLLTTDWALENVIDRAFPGYVSWYKGYYTDGSQSRLVDAVVVGEDRALLAGVPPIGHWQLVKKSQIARVIRPQNVEVLARSRTMQEDPSGLGILAASFRFGTGRVLHLVGHFDNNSELAFNTALPDPAPGLKISLRQAIAANFVAEALEQGNTHEEKPSE